MTPREKPRYGDQDAERIARALGGARRTGGGWSCRCPAHEDRHNSLSLTASDGRLLWRCHASCSQNDVQAALAREGLIEPAKTYANGHARPRNPAPTRPAARPSARDNVTAIGRIVATYDYVDVTGALLFQVVRFEPKTFRQRRPDGGGWSWGLGRTRPVLYRLPEVLAAQAVFVCEGEKGADRLRELGLTATNSPMGAGKWRPEYGEYLAGKHVVIFPNNDDAGRRHAEDVAASAREHGAASIRVVALPKLPDKGDEVDWLDAGGTREKLEQIVRGTALWGCDESGADPGWRHRLLSGDRGVLANEANAEMALMLAPELIGRVRFDAFRGATQRQDMPWDRRPEWRDWTDNDSTKLAIWLQHAGIDIRALRIDPVIEAVGAQNEHHPVRRYLDGLKWDGRNRVDDWLITYLGCKWSEERPELYRYLRAVGTRWLISAVARVMEPGCKADCALVLEGEQGKGKSTAAHTLCGAEWFADQIAELGTKDASQDLRGKWIIELAEMNATARAEIKTVKEYLSRREDHYRPSFGRRSGDHPRQCVFIGTTNAYASVKDESGARRFWFVRTGKIDIPKLKRDRDQLWAEAVVLYRKGEQWWLKDDEEAIAKQEQEERDEGDAWDALIEEWLSRTTLTFITIGDILHEALNLPRDRWGQLEQNRVARYLRRAGWIRRRSPKGARVWGYERMRGDE